MARTLALISCTKKKHASPLPAAELYSASPGFRLAYAYGRRVADDVLILSAKYGPLRPTDVIEPYEQTLKRTPQALKRDWAAITFSCLRDMPEYRDALKVIWLAGRDYYDQLLPLITSDGRTSELPLEHMQQGKRSQWLRAQLATCTCLRA